VSIKKLNSNFYLGLSVTSQGRSISGSPFLLQRSVDLLSDLLTGFKPVDDHRGLRAKVFSDRRLIVTDGDLGALVNTASVLVCDTERCFLREVKLGRRRRRRRGVHVGGEECRINQKRMVLVWKSCHVVSLGWKCKLSRRKVMKERDAVVWRSQEKMVCDKTKRVCGLYI